MRQLGDIWNLFVGIDDKCDLGSVAPSGEMTGCPGSRSIRNAR